MLEVDGLVKSYRSKGAGGEIKAVRGVSFGIDSGEVLSFLGPNGAGKTTTIKMIAGLIEPHEGTIKIAGMDPQRDHAVAREIGAVFEGSRNIYWRLTCEENMEYFGALRGLSRRMAQKRGGELLGRFGLADRGRSQVRFLSRGMQQKVAFAVAILHEPHLLLLDEPTLGLDPQSCEDIKVLIRELANEGRTVLLTTHQLDVAEALADRLVLIRNGKLVLNGTMVEILNNATDTAYRIQFSGCLSAEQISMLTALEARLDGQSLLYQGSALGLYGVIEALKPLEIISLGCERKRLSDVFFKLAYDECDATSSAN